MYQDQSSLIYFNRLLFAKLAKSKEDNGNKARFENEPTYTFMKLYLLKKLSTLCMNQKENLILCVQKLSFH